MFENASELLHRYDTLEVSFAAYLALEHCLISSFKVFIPILCDIYNFEYRKI